MSKEAVKPDKSDGKPVRLTKADSYPVLRFTDESVLMDLKALLIEAKQKVPPVLQVLQTENEDLGGDRPSSSSSLSLFLISTLLSVGTVPMYHLILICVTQLTRFWLVHVNCC